MKKSVLLLCVFSLVLSCQSVKKPVLLETGISKELAIFRKSQISDVFYTLSFDIPKKKEEPIVSTLKVDLKINNNKEPLYLDFNEKKENLKKVVVNGKEIIVLHEKQHLIIPKENLLLGANKIEVNFIAGNLSLNRNDDFLYTLLVPDRASTLFPCFDQPDIKANYTLEIKAPKDWAVLTSSAVSKETQEGDFIRYQFEQSDKMSTYLFSFVAGEFKSSSQAAGFPMKMLFRENNDEKVKASTATIFDLHRQAISYLEQYTNFPFPFKKMDFAAIPVFQYGGMEHVGAIQYKESSLFLDNSATDSEKLTRGKLIAHETSHMWFGDLVTMKWFDDVWMKEVFANFMADKIMNPAFPNTNHNLQFLTAHYPAAYSEDRTKGTHPIRQELANLKNAGSLYGGIIYYKAPIMMRQLETTMGKEAFQKGIQKYIRKYANDNATWENLVEILDAETSMDLKKWSAVWVNQSGRALFKDKIIYDENGKIKKFEIQQQAEDGSSNVWPQLFEVGFVYPDTTKVFNVAVVGQTTDLKEVVGLGKPLAVIYNYNGYGYGVFPIDRSLLDSIALVKDDVARAYSYINLYENTLTGTIAPQLAFDVCLKGINVEKNELIAKLLTEQLNSLFWNFLTKKQQLLSQSRLEAVVYNRMQEDLPSNIKKTLFVLFQNMAYSEIASEKLFKVWNKEVVIASLKLNEEDFTSMAMSLVLFNQHNSDEILVKARVSISNPDKLKRFDFLLPSLSNDEMVRDGFMESLKEDENREKESWVQSALANINHPLRQESAKKYLKQCLELTEEIQLTGDIFFPKGWLSNSIEKYSSAEALDIVNKFLKENPEFSPILKRKLLQATDDLSRAQLIKKDN
ncbi:M1 family metallopeptidase [Flavobacterium degerlachei]|jgi:aminopeptidase N|uniref:Aminopeptidase N n=1 Tax=Flavobacterium degerlachei TaxID=229203 RepID=A0A1H2PXN9_9FLAO|nr:M1 family aminopeptidase [Flavobacterium degerlachei]SDV99660.1 aminopeptidase N [Flavobacterium degerlachei]